MARLTHHTFLLASASALAIGLAAAGPTWAANFTAPPDITNGQAMAAGDTLTVGNTGSVTNTSGNDAVSGTGAASISNAGSMTATGTSGAAIELNGNIVSITNTGTMSTEKYNVVYIHGDITGTFLNDVGGTITTSTDQTTRVTGTTDTFINRGTISNTGTGDGGSTFGGMVTNFTNASGATISVVGGDAVRFSGGLGTGSNAGTLTGTGGTGRGLVIGPEGGVTFAASGTFTNTGTIEGFNAVYYRDHALGGTFINSGSIIAHGGSAIFMSGSADTLTLMTGSTTTGTVNGNGGSDLLQLDGTTTGTFAIDQLVNFETLQKLGTGSWSLSGDNTAAMTATIDTGRLAINGNMGSTNITINAGTLGGNGTVGTVDVHATAHVAPGNSVGTLHTGSISFANDSNYDVEIASNVADKIVVTGTAFIGSNVTLTVTGNSTSCGNLSLPILTTTGGLTGTFTLSTLLSNVSITSDANNYYLNTTGGTGRIFTGFTTTPNQASTAAALDAMGCGNQPYSAQLAALTDAQVPGAMDALSGAGHASIAGALVEGSHYLPGIINDRIEQAFAALDTRGVVSNYFGGPMLIEQIDGLTVWGSGYGGLAGQAGNGNANGWQSGASGVVLGADGKVNEDVRLGVLGGIGITGISSEATTGTSTDLSGGVYGGGQFGPVSIKGGLLYTRHLIQTSRAIVFPGVSDTVTASYQAGTAQLYFEVGHDFEAYGMTFTPFARFNALNHSTDAFTETGGQGQLSTKASVVNALFVTLGVSAEDKFVLNDTLLVTARGSVGWRHAFGDTPTVVNSFTNGGSFTVTGSPLAADAAMLEASAVLDLSETTSLKLGYDGLVGSGLASGAVTATFAGKF